MRSKANKQLA